jgi:hypothetical protein
MDIFFGCFLRNSANNILSTVTKCSTCGSLLNAVDTAFSASVIAAPLVSKFRYSCTTFSKINNMT